MKNLIKLTALLALSLQCIPAFAQDDRMEKLLLEMEKADKNVQTVNFKFKQEITYTLNGEKQSSAGEFFYKRPASLCYQQTQPVKQTITANDKKVWIYTPSYNQVVVDSWKKWLKNGMIPDSLINFSSGFKELKKNYVFEYVGEDQNTYNIKLKPVNASSGRWEIHVWINKKGYFPEKLLLAGENISVTTLCQNYTVNEKFDESIFKFVPPKGADVIEMP